MRRTRVTAGTAIAAAAAASALVACNLIAGFADEYTVDPLASETGSPDGPSSPEASTDDQTSPPDALVDSAPPDARFTCALVDADFCDDFENGAVGDGGGTEWTGVVRSHDASIQVMGDAGIGGSFGLDIDTYSPTTASRQAYVFKTLAAESASNEYLAYQLDFDVRIFTTELSYAAHAVLNFTGATQEDHGIATYTPGAAIGRLTPRIEAVAIGTNQWHHVRLLLDHAAPATPFKRQIWVDGRSVDGDAGTTGHVTNGAATGEVRMGVFYTAGIGRAHATFDNVVVRRR